MPRHGKSKHSKVKKRSTVEDFPPINDLSSFLTYAKTQFEHSWKNEDIPRANISDFELYRTLGKGAFGRVVLAKHKPSNVYCATKVLDKAKIVQSRLVRHTYNEMKMLLSVHFPFLVHMLYVMKDNSYLYFTMPFIIGGEMYGHLVKLRRFDEDHAKFYAVQVCLALEYLHFLDVLYRDLKPENILIDNRGYLKITDMGFCKIVKGRTYTFCGTPEYIPPEIILNKGYGKSADWWSFGVLLYEMTSGYTPFHSRDVMKLYDQITSGHYKPIPNQDEDLTNLISGLLQVDPTKRLGCLKNGVDDIKNHKWFKYVNWLGVLNRTIQPHYVPIYDNEEDCANFEKIPEVPLEVATIDTYEKEFEDF